MGAYTVTTSKRYGGKNIHCKICKWSRIVLDNESTVQAYSSHAKSYMHRQALQKRTKKRVALHVSSKAKK